MERKKKDLQNIMRTVEIQEKQAQKAKYLIKQMEAQK